jgi:hypothetical protein
MIFGSRVSGNRERGFGVRVLSGSRRAIVEWRRVPDSVNHVCGEFGRAGSRIFVVIPEAAIRTSSLFPIDLLWKGSRRGLNRVEK